MNFVATLRERKSLGELMGCHREADIGDHAILSSEQAWQPYSREYDGCLVIKVHGCNVL